LWWWPLLDSLSLGDIFSRRMLMAIGPRFSSIPGWIAKVVLIMSFPE
jgi:hypothetical protein